MRGQCEQLIGRFNIYRAPKVIEFWVHPDDSMNMPCWEARPKKVKPA